MARDADGKPKETRGRRGMSQKIRDLSEQMKGWSSLGESLPKWIETASSIGFIGWILLSLRPRIDVYWNENGVYKYRGERVSKIIISHPYGRGGPFVLSQIILLLNLPSGDWFELAEDATIYLFFHDLYDNYMFTEEPLNLEFAEPKAVPHPVKNIEYPFDVTVYVTEQLVKRWITVFAFAGIIMILLKRGLIPPST